MDLWDVLALCALILRAASGNFPGFERSDTSELCWEKHRSFKQSFAWHEVESKSFRHVHKRMAVGVGCIECVNCNQRILWTFYSSINLIPLVKNIWRPVCYAQSVLQSTVHATSCTRTSWRPDASVHCFCEPTVSKHPNIQNTCINTKTSDLLGQSALNMRRPMLPRAGRKPSRPPAWQRAITIQMIIYDTCWTLLN